MFLFLAMLFGCVGLGFFVYGKRESAIVPLVVGIALMVVPYLITNPATLFLVGCLLVAAPYFFRG